MVGFEEEKMEWKGPVLSSIILKQPKRIQAEEAE